MPCTYIWDKNIYLEGFLSMASRCGSFPEKTLKKSTCAVVIKNYYYFQKSNIPVINLIVDSRNISKILPHSKTIKDAKKLSVFRENDTHRLSNSLQIPIFWKFDHISRTYNQINYRNICFAKVTIILTMVAQVLFSIFFSKRSHTLIPLILQTFCDMVRISIWLILFSPMENVFPNLLKFLKF